MKSRTKARAIALQALYEIDLTGHKIGDVLAERLEESKLDSDLNEFSMQIVRGVLQLVDPIDQYIIQYAPEWPLDQVAVIDRNILRIALWEFAFQGDTPTKVAINEAVELAKLFGSDSSPRFVNGVLGSLASRQNEIRQTFYPLLKVDPDKESH